MKVSTEEFSLSLTYISFIIGMELYVLVNAVATLFVTLGRVSRASGKENNFYYHYIRVIAL